MEVEAHRRRNQDAMVDRRCLAIMLALTAGIAASPGVVIGALPEPGSGSAQQSAPDSTELEERLQSRQRAFERLRRRSFPRTMEGRSPDCHEIIGRYCFWHEEEAREPPPESPEVTEARLRLVGALDSAARRFPGSDWVAGQRVRYLVEADRPAAAREAAHACRAASWWCRSLLGYARHTSGDYAGAEAAFDEALEWMPSDRRCAWTDVELLLDGDARDRYADLPCGARDAFHGRFWRLSDPLYLVPGNERRSEHFSRRVLDRLQDDAAGPYGDRWGRDLAEILLRYGWAVEWERTWETPAGSRSRSSIVARHASHGQRFVPPDDVLADPASVAPDGWDLDPEQPRSAYAPRYASGVASLDHQLAAFRRGDSTRLVAAYRLPPDSLGDGGGDTEALLEVRDADGRPLAAHRRSAADRRGTLTETLATRPVLVSLEVRAAGGSFAARARYGRRLAWRPAGALEASDVLVLERRVRPTSLEEAARLARGDLEVPPGIALGLYWEIYGLPRDAVFDVSVRIRRSEGGGLLRGIARTLGLVGGDEEVVGLGWTDRPEEREEAGGSEARGPVDARPTSVSLTLPETLDEGVYRIEVEVRLPGFEPLRTWRQIRVHRDARPPSSDDGSAIPGADTH